MEFYAEGGGAPVLEWLRDLPKKARAKGIVRLELLGEKGHELRRPHADLLRDGIHELRWRFGTVNYRLLYAFYGSTVVVLLHALTKEREVPSRDIDLAVTRLARYRRAPEEHTHEEEI